MRLAVPFLALLLLLVACDEPPREPERESLPFAMPTLVDHPLDKAREICAQWEMDFAVMEERLKYGREEGTVLCQWPKPGDDARAGDVAVVVLSTKPEKVRVPNLHGLTITQAECRLSEKGLRVDPRKCYRYDGSVARDRLIDYDPGQLVFAGSDVQVIISKGPIPRGGGDVNTMRLGE